jgi:hypothetical protein
MAQKLQPHSQFVVAHSHDSGGHPQSHVSHTQVPQQVVLFVFSRLDIVFLLFSIERLMRFQKG